jgi:hypothetical protein
MGYVSRAAARMATAADAMKPTTEKTTIAMTRRPDPPGDERERREDADHREQGHAYHRDGVEAPGRAHRLGARGYVGRRAKRHNRGPTGDRVGPSFRRFRHRPRPSIQLSSVRTATPVPPRVTSPVSDRARAVPAMSRCAHGVPRLTNCFKNKAPMIDEP